MSHQEIHNKTVEVRALRIGEGIPKICVPMTGKTVRDLCNEAELLRKAGADLAEWRVDWFTQWRSEDSVDEALHLIRSSLKEIPLLVTFRTHLEGGNSEITTEEYGNLYRTVLNSGQADLIDLELFFDDTVVSELITEAKAAGVKIVCSNHDFTKTPDEGELRSRLKKMEQLGADIAKIAVMPRSAGDVAVLLKVTAESAEELNCPVITMSMGRTGVISRMAGQIFGSCVTFGTVGNASAPGQIPLEQLKEVLSLIDSVQ
ncbi:MAG: type I 3-dehydroquinate dehydratase [Firmicutes bacterium]|nr:type I 3-dehydroquinate dehydratase [Bacillota bacterium]